jgi:hypothetical protein
VWFEIESFYEYLDFYMNYMASLLICQNLIAPKKILNLVETSVTFVCIHVNKVTWNEYDIDLPNNFLRCDLQILIKYRIFLWPLHYFLCGRYGVVAHILVQWFLTELWPFNYFYFKVCLELSSYTTNAISLKLYRIDW